MIAVYLFPLYVLVNLYVFRWGIRYMSACSRHFKKKGIRIFIGIVYTFFALSLGIGFFLKPSMMQRFFKCLGNYWLGVSLYDSCDCNRRFGTFFAETNTLDSTRTTLFPQDICNYRNMLCDSDCICFRVRSTSCAPYPDYPL